MDSNALICSVCFESKEGRQAGHQKYYVEARRAVQPAQVQLFDSAMQAFDPR